MSDMRSSLHHVRGLGSAKSGIAHFWAQRLTALASVPLALFLIALLLALIGADYATVRSYLANPSVTIPRMLLILTGTLHMYLGMQVIIEDYVHASTLKFASLVCNIFFSAAVALACLYAVLKIGLNS